jgi:hypothetical protein
MMRAEREAGRYLGNDAAVGVRVPDLQALPRRAGGPTGVAPPDLHTPTLDAGEIDLARRFVLGSATRRSGLF